MLHWRPALLLDAKNRTLSFAVSLTCSHTHSLIHPPNRMRVGFGGGCMTRLYSVSADWLSFHPCYPGSPSLPFTQAFDFLAPSLRLSPPLCSPRAPPNCFFFYPTSSCIFDKQNMIALQRKENNEWLQLELLFSHLLLPFQRKEKKNHSHKCFIANKKVSVCFILFLCLCSQWVTVRC